MRFWVSIWLILTLNVVVKGQDTFTVQAVAGTNSELNEMACGLFYGQVLISKQAETNEFDDRGRATNSYYHLAHAEKKDTYSNLLTADLFEFNALLGDNGTACFSELDSTLYYSSVRRSRRETFIQIFSRKWLGDKWGEEVSFDHNQEDCHSAHPFVSADGNTLVFSSNRAGGAGKMDLWFCNRIANQWSKPVWLSSGVNSTANELFPTMLNQDIYFSSDVAGQMDIYELSKKSQWKEKRKLDEPINSASDDLMLVFLDDNTAFLTSSREGDNDNIYLIRRSFQGIDGYTVEMECRGTPVQSAEISFVNQLDEIVLKDTTSLEGTMALSNVNFQTNYQVNVAVVDDKVLSQSVIYVRNSAGEIIKTYRPGADGTFYFELLQGDRPQSPDLLDNEDESILSLDIAGQIYAEEPGDVGQGEMIYVTDDDGNLLAMTYTSQEGKFVFEELRPLKDYHFKSTGEATKMVIYEDGKEVEVGVSGGMFTYEKLSEDEAFQLLDEHRKPIFIGKEEVFIIRNIYYEFDSASINVVARQQLDHLATILKNNPQIEIELSSHTDSRGELEYNRELSVRRAEIAKTYIAGLGIAEARILARGFGEERLLNDCGDSADCPEELHALNRRTEIRILVEE